MEQVPAHGSDSGLSASCFSCCCFFCSVGCWGRSAGLAHPRHVLCHWATSPAPGVSCAQSIESKDPVQMWFPGALCFPKGPETTEQEGQPLTVLLHRDLWKPCACHIFHPPPFPSQDLVMSLSKFFQNQSSHSLPPPYTGKWVFLGRGHFMCLFCFSEDQILLQSYGSSP